MITEAGRELLREGRLADSKDPAQLELPWGGRSPRDLTRAAKRFRLKSRDDDVHTDFQEGLTDEQYRRFLYLESEGDY